AWHAGKLELFAFKSRRGSPNRPRDRGPHAMRMAGRPDCPDLRLYFEASVLVVLELGACGEAQFVGNQIEFVLRKHATRRRSYPCRNSSNRKTFVQGSRGCVHVQTPC